ncbi:MAG TPA: sigma-54 dependent transcriptional regulator [Candidatus Acidoferrales bacterium]|jgi:two-component system response regulator AtoC|nr:sigma-54 dependent transcriptional regulator [Candidatus Acidoferrales bacterium]
MLPIWYSGCEFYALSGGFFYFDSMAATGYQFALIGGNASEELPSDAVVFGRSEAMRTIRQRIEKVAGTKLPILLQGESGTGKELIARMIHRKSERAAGPFLKVNCPAIPGTLMESELFGYEKGSFTGAYGSKPGRAELADGGTLFLDEISEMDLGLQAKLLQLLQDNQFWRIGAREETRVDVRIICATNRQLEVDIQSGRFRPDLFYRINVLKIQLPPLRERIEDLGELVGHFLKFFSRKHNVNPPAPSSTLVQLFQTHRWPGNIRELSNLIERYAILGSEESVTNELLSASTSIEGDVEIPSSGPLPLKAVTRQTVQQLERKIILRTLIAHRWNRKRAAKDLKISYRALLYKIRQAGLPSRRPAIAGQAQSFPSAIPEILPTE